MFVSVGSCLLCVVGCCYWWLPVVVVGNSWCLLVTVGTWCVWLLVCCSLLVVVPVAVGC